MQLKVGSYACDPNATLVTSSSEMVWNAGGQSYEQKVSLDVSGYLTGTSQADLTQKASALATALAKPFPDIVFLNDDGTPSQTQLKNAGSITGVRVKGPNFPTASGPEYASLRSFSFSAEAVYPLPNTGALLLSFTETLSFSGGGPLYAHRLAINGPPQKQMVYPATVYRVTQSGSCEGYLAAPPVTPPIWPFALKEAPHIRRTSPRRMGKGYEGFGLTWQYEFESATPLVGIPTPWRN